MQETARSISCTSEEAVSQCRLERAVDFQALLDEEKKNWMPLPPNLASMPLWLSKMQSSTDRCLFFREGSHLLLPLDISSAPSPLQNVRFSENAANDTREILKGGNFPSAFDCLPGQIYSHEVLHAAFCSALLRQHSQLDPL